MLPLEREQEEIPMEMQPQRPNDNDIAEFGVPKRDDEKPNPIQCISIIGQVEGHMALPPQNKTTKYEHIIPMLVEIEQNEDVKGFVVVLNTVGGDVEAGLAIAEMIAGMSKPSVSLVLGGGHSIGVPLAVSADYSFIAPTATMTLHPIRMTGIVIGVPQTYDYLGKMQNRIVSFISSYSGISEQSVMEFMLRTDEMANDTGTILIGAQAVECSLINRVGTFADAIAKAKELAGLPAGEMPE